MRWKLLASCGGEHGSTINRGENSMARVISEWIVDKSGSTVDGGMVVAKQDPAALAGAKMLELGGNAIDAAVAAAFVMNVMEPYNCSIGGAGYMVVRLNNGESHVVDFSVRAPAKATEEALKSRTTAAFTGPLAAAVPGTVAGLALALEKFGSLPLSVVMQPAIEVAIDGMPLDWMLTLRLVQSLEGIRANPKTAEIFLTNGDPGMAYGETVIRQPELAETLQAIAEEGPRVFYEGPIADEIVKFVQERGGILESSDLAGYEARILEPVRGTFRDYDLIGAPLPSPSVMTIQGLQILEGFDLAGYGHNSVEALHVLAETYRMGFADRDAYFGDPDFTAPVSDALLAPEYIEQRRNEINLSSAMKTVSPGKISVPATGKQGGGEGTTHIAVVDEAGNAVSLTHTLIGGMTGLGVAGNTGVVMNTCLQWFDAQRGAPNSVAPGKRPVTNMTPMIVERNGQVVLAVGAPGGRRISNAVSQVILNALEFNKPIQRAISAPRIDLSLGHVLADDRIDPAVLDGLRNLGHTVEPVFEFINAGGPQTGYRGNMARPAAVYVDENGLRHGGDYPFVQGIAVGVPRK